MFQIKLLICNVLLWLSLLPETIRYIIALLSPKYAQEKVLKNILIKTGVSRDTFTRLPLTKYDDYVNQIEIIKTTGEHPTYREKVLRLCATSGTSGRNKLIPYTKSLKDAFQRGLYPWIFFMYIRFPFLFLKRQYWSITPVIQTREDNVTSKVIIGFEDDEEYIGSLQRYIIKTVWVDTKKIVDNCPNIETFLSRLAIHLSKEKMLGLVSVWSPSLISLLIKKHKTVLPKKLLLSSWAHSHSKGESDCVVRTMAVILQPKGLLSTEACVTIPIGTDTFFLSYNSHFFEFRDTNTNKIETVTTVEVGLEYEMVVTTQSGFLRYATGDIVQVEKFIFGRPSCVFVGRVGVIDLFGEKLDERTVEKAVSSLLGESIAKESFWFLAPTRNIDDLISYTLFIKLKVVDVELVKKLDTLLRIAYHYNYCRELGQLSQARIFIIKDSSPETIFIEISSDDSGARLGDVKLCRLSKKFDWHSEFSGHFIEP